MTSEVVGSRRVRKNTVYIFKWLCSRASSMINAAHADPRKKLLKLHSSPTLSQTNSCPVMMSERLFVWKLKTVGSKQSGRAASQLQPLLPQQFARVCAVTCPCESERARLCVGQMNV